MRFPPLKALPVFLSICKHLSFSRAAEELCLTHAAVSYNLRQLEDFLGVKLIHRTTRSVSITREGKIYQEGIARALRLIETTTANVINKREVVRFNVLYSLAMKYLIPKLPEFTASLPDIDLQVSTLSKSADELFAHDIDVAIVYDRKQRLQNYVVYIFKKDSLVMVGTPDKMNKGKTMSELTLNQTVLMVSGSLRENDWLRWWLYIGEKKRDCYKIMHFQSTVQAIEAAISGLGILVTHKPFVESALESGVLVQLSEKEVVTDESYYIITTPEKIKSKNVKSCIAWLQNK